MKFKIILNKIIKTIFPDNYSCIICNKEINQNNMYGICEECSKKLPYTSDKICEICGVPLTSMATVCLKCKNTKNTFKIARAPFVYSDNIAFLIKKLKYENGKYVAKYLAKFMADCYIKNNLDCDIILPVPLHKNRIKKRGYNQSELLSKYLSDFLNIPTVNNCLTRIKDTITQTNLNYLQRQTNLCDAFNVVDKSIIKNKNVLLVDDVFTTGATSRNCAKLLLKNGVKSVAVLCVAHTVINEKD